MKHALRLLVSMLLLPACIPSGGIAAPGADGGADAIVDPRYTGEDGAAVNGVPTFATIGAALTAAPADGARTHVVFVRNGRYYEKLSVEKPDLHLRGESRDGTVLTFDAAAGHPRPDGQGTWGTRGSFTLRVAAPRFRLENMTVENGFDYPANAALSPDDPARVQHPQAVALLLERGSDQAVFTGCTLSGFQDTLFADAGRAYFHRCTILGHVDFIFGAGQAVFEESDIVSRDRGSRANNGYVAAPSTLKSQPYGFLFLNSRLLKEHPGLAPGSVMLGRPWRPSGNPQSAGSAVYVNVYMDDHVGAQGWDQMGGFPPEEARLFEYGSTGPGALKSPTRRVLTTAEAEYYTAAQVLRGWQPRP